MKTRTILLILGFLLFVTGMISLVLILIGANLSYLAWIDKPGSPRGLLIRLVMIGGGLVLSYVALNPGTDANDDANSSR
jgi:hypothetical protein